VPYDEHRPQLPLHFVSPQTFNKCRTLMEKPNILLDWQGHVYVVKEVYHGYLKLVSVITKQEYLSRFGPPTSLINYPDEHLIRTEVYVETEEAFLIQTKKNHTQRFFKGGRTTCEKNT